MKEKWLQAEIFSKSILISLIFSSIMISIGCILIVIDNSYIYGVLVGTIILYVSYFFIWLLWYKIPKIKTTMAKATPYLSPLIRIIFFLTVFLLIIFFVNQGDGVQIFLDPINTLMMLITYTTTLLSYGVVIFIDNKLEKEMKEVN